MKDHELAGKLRVIAMLIDALADQLIETPTTTIGAPRRTLDEAIWFCVTNYEEKVLFVKHGHKQRAGRTRQALFKHSSPREGVIELLSNRKSSMGLRELAAIGELHNSFEQMVIDYAEDFPSALVIKAHTNLGAFLN
jgi:hypothetical protein